MSIVGTSLLQSSREVGLEPEVHLKWYYPALAPFSKHYREKARVGRTDPADRIVLDHVVSASWPRVVFTKNSKSACTTITHAIYVLACGAQYSGKIHREHKVLAQGRAHWDTNITRFASAEYKAFTFVRHPVDRLESAFRDFVLEKRNSSLDYHKAQLQAFGVSDKRDQAYNYDAFLDYVEACLGESSIRTDRHWRRQVDNIGVGRFQYDFVGRVENLAKDLRTFLEEVGVETDTNERVSSIHDNASRKSNWIASSSQVSRIRDLYNEDFEAFGYQ